MTINKTAGAPPDHDPFGFLTLGETAKWARISLRTFQREIAEGRGPDIVRISKRRSFTTPAGRAAWVQRRMKRSKYVNDPVQHQAAREHTR